MDKSDRTRLFRRASGAILAELACQMLDKSAKSGRLARPACGNSPAPGPAHQMTDGGIGETHG